MNIVDSLKKLPDNSGQIVSLQLSKRTIKCVFLWFYKDNIIDLKPVDNINVISIHKRFWNKISICNE